MPEPALPVGKIPTPLLAELLGGLPALDGAVRVGPAVGEDAAAIDVPAGTLVAATDPITLTGSDAGRYAVLINANDVAVSGATPRWFLVAMLLPPGTTGAEVRATVDELAAALEEVGACLVGGHTEVTPAVTQPVLVGQMLGMAGQRLVTTSGASPGDVLLQVGPAPVEGAAVLAADAADRLTEVPTDLLQAAADAAVTPGIAVVRAALAAADLGATAMHDPTEGGLAAGLHELAHAAAVRLHLDVDAVQWFEPGLAVCAALGADPWATLASGCLLATFPEEVAADAGSALRDAGHPTAAIGRVGQGRGVVAGDLEIPWPERDELARLL